MDKSEINWLITSSILSFLDFYLYKGIVEDTAPKGLVLKE